MATPTIIAVYVLQFFNICAVLVFALSGALLAARLKQTIVTMAFFALITGAGGGTIRDLLIGAPIFWMQDPMVAPLCLSAAIIVWFAPARIWRGQLLEWLDAMGMAAFSVLGTAKALAFGAAPVPAMLMGIITGCAGGIVRDIMAGEPSILMRPELYVTASALSAFACWTCLSIGIAPSLSWVVASLLGFGLRGIALRYKLQLPAYERGKD